MTDDSLIVRLWREGNRLRISFAGETWSRDVAGMKQDEVDRIVEATKDVIRSATAGRKREGSS